MAGTTSHGYQDKGMAGEEFRARSVSSPSWPGAVPAICASTVGGRDCGLRDAHISETAMKSHEIKCLLDGCERFPIVMARLVRATYTRTCRDRWPGQAGPGRGGNGRGGSIPRSVHAVGLVRAIYSSTCAATDGLDKPGHDD